MGFGLIIVVIVALVLLVLAVTYNRLVALRQTRENAFADIDVQLLKRADLVPNLVETVKGYASHEKGVLESVTEARSRAMRGGSVNDKIEANNQLSQALMNLMAIAENYPALKADTSFTLLQQQLGDLETSLAAARRFFNNATNELNTAIAQLPAVLFAGALGFTVQPFFEVDEARRTEMQKPPTVSL